MAMDLRIGVDLGGTKIEAIALDRSGATLARKRVDTPRGNYPATVEAIGSLVEDVEREAGGRGTVGMATPGARSLETGLMKNCNSVWLNGQPLPEDVAKRLARPVRIANDANCFALSEAVDGSARGAQSCFGVILGTGCGGGIVVRGAIVEGANSIAGEWGHNPLPAPRPEDQPLPPCYCGRLGCIETFLSGPGLAADHERVSGERLEAARIAQRAGEADAACLRTLERYGERLARSLAVVINILDPDVVVLGGGLSSIARLYERVPRLWGAHVISDSVRTRLAPPTHGDSGGVRGAAWLWNDA